MSHGHNDKKVSLFGKLSGVGWHIRVCCACRDEPREASTTTDLELEALSPCPLLHLNLSLTNYSHVLPCYNEYSTRRIRSRSKCARRENACPAICRSSTCRTICGCSKKLCSSMVVSTKVRLTWYCAGTTKLPSGAIMCTVLER